MPGELTLPAKIALIVLGCLAAGDAVLAPAPQPSEPGFVDTILASRAALAAIRITLVFAGAFVVVSVVALIANRQWLIRIGPVEVSERLSDVDLEDRRLEESLDAADKTIQDLKGKVDRASSALDQELAEKGGGPR
jgi:hypothetical protein